MGHLAELDEEKLAEFSAIDPARLAIVLKTAAIAGDAVLDSVGMGAGDWLVETPLSAGPNGPVLESVWRVSPSTGIPRLVAVRETAPTARASP